MQFRSAICDGFASNLNTFSSGWQVERAVIDALKVIEELCLAHSLATATVSAAAAKAHMLADIADYNDLHAPLCEESTSVSSYRCLRRATDLVNAQGSPIIDTRAFEAPTLRLQSDIRFPCIEIGNLGQDTNMSRVRLASLQVKVSMSISGDDPLTSSYACDGQQCTLYGPAHCWSEVAQQQAIGTLGYPMFEIASSGVTLSFRGVIIRDAYAFCGGVEYSAQSRVNVHFESSQTVSNTGTFGAVVGIRHMDTTDHVLGNITFNSTVAANNEAMVYSW